MFIKEAGGQVRTVSVSFEFEEEAELKDYKTAQNKANT